MPRSTPPPAGGLHPRNLHAGRYDFPALCSACPELTAHLRPSPSGDHTIDFADAAAVLCLNQALLAHHYQVRHWQIPPGYLCPGIPGRADMIHHLADLLARHRGGGENVRVLDTGTGANCIYPILGSRIHGWKFTGSDIDPAAVAAARAVVTANPCLTGQIEIVLQKDPSRIFKGIIGNGHYDLTLCNPPFHSSRQAARAGSERKQRNLARTESRRARPGLNFGGQNTELWCPGGELQFVSRMIEESTVFAARVGWFTTLISKNENLPPLRRILAKTPAARIEIIPMSHGQKRSRILAWTFRA